MPYGAMLVQVQAVTVMVMLRPLSSPASCSWFFLFLPVLCPPSIPPVLGGAGFLLVLPLLLG